MSFESLCLSGINTYIINYPTSLELASDCVLRASGVICDTCVPPYHWQVMLSRLQPRARLEIVRLLRV